MHTFFQCLEQHSDFKKILSLCKTDLVNLIENTNEEEVVNNHRIKLTVSTKRKGQQTLIHRQKQTR